MFQPVTSRRLLAFVIGFLLALGLADAANAQVRYGYVIEPARSTMAAAWDDTSAYQVERLFQVTRDTTFEKVGAGGILEQYVVVTDVVACRTVLATPYHVEAECPDENAPVIHVHTPTTCYDAAATQCVRGGLQAYDANPSTQDRLYMRQWRSTYAAIQVSREVFVFYFPGQELLDERAAEPSMGGRDAYLVLLGGVVTANAIGHFITDPGGYPKQWDQWSVFHFTAGFGIESLGESMHVPMRWRLPVACGSLGAWELTKGYSDWRDVAAGCAGVLTSAGLRAALRRLF